MCSGRVDKARAARPPAHLLVRLRSIWNGGDFRISMLLELCSLAPSQLILWHKIILSQVVIGAEMWTIKTKLMFRLENY